MYTIIPVDKFGHLMSQCHGVYPCKAEARQRLVSKGYEETAPATDVFRSYDLGGCAFAIVYVDDAENSLWFE